MYSMRENADIDAEGCAHDRVRSFCSGQEVDGSRLSDLKSRVGRHHSCHFDQLADIHPHSVQALVDSHQHSVQALVDTHQRSVEVLVDILLHSAG